jgi:hypothetical protein
MTTSDPLHRTTDYLDTDRTACLCDVGAPDYLAATMIGPDGEHRFVLCRRDLINDPTIRYDPACTDAPHEQLGPLPPRWAARTRLAPLRCGRSTKAGRACRTPVARPGDACAWHRNSYAQSRALKGRDDGPTPTD